jgi:hypothetical protein
MKGRGAWMLSITSFIWLAACEAVAAALGVGWFAVPMRSPRVTISYHGVALALLAAALFSLCVVVLGYLGSDKARDTFALPPGETPLVVQHLPAIAITIFVIAVLFGGAIGLS